MPPAVVVNITVHANRVDHSVDITGVPYEAGLRQSLISVDNARATHGRIEPTEAVLSLKDAAGRTYTSSSYITLIWWFWGETISNREDFYITEDLPTGCNAMLRRTSDDGKPQKKALPLFTKPQTNDSTRPLPPNIGFFNLRLSGVNTELLTEAFEVAAPQQRGAHSRLKL
ncbi:hypothetical protein EPUS_08900 [Endocarpon pusillum Z07020]|uniref:Uncharacterized protein n=1 Tax=Endocarpon pusillum (strain Z07020 / HMAS-L-300199) TaxID=1263415 RepID=U1GQD5_ENDPU|nr:uncharacterized protein EPUS_08900 [Endocarpon pusillum Z07020]ERF74161.1 hypothetical protein EPUS_08900 [Endocarpon pusillum Z07020]